MKVIRGVGELKSELGRRKTVLTVGNFDGVHRGHQSLIRKVVDWSHAIGNDTQAALMTFEPHPRQILKPEQKFNRLFSLGDQETRMRELGINVFILEPFSRDLSDLAPDAFLSQVLLRPLNPVGLVVGYDFSFGRDRAGTIEFLQKWGTQVGVPVEIIPPVRVNGEIVSSTRIRRAIAEGDIQLANEMLNRIFQIEGWVERGAGRGRTIGIPTANIHNVDGTIPRGGVYVTDSWADGEWRRSVTNIGTNPTFLAEGTSFRVETHILDFAGELYGKSLQVRFLARLRDEQKFHSAQELVAQIHQDIQRARHWRSVSEGRNA